MSKFLFDAVTGRPGRGSPVIDGEGGDTWSGVIVDSNMPDNEHWIHKLYEQAQAGLLDGYRFYLQPGALLETSPGVYIDNPKAENVSHYTDGHKYWRRQVPGKDREWVKVYVLGQWGMVFEGRPVYDGFFDPDRHVSKEPLKANRMLPLRLCQDYGLTPACLFYQVRPNGQLVFLREFYEEDGGAYQLRWNQLQPAITNDFNGMRIYGVGDPSNRRSDSDSEQSPISVMNADPPRGGLNIVPALTNDFITRRDAMLFYFSRMIKNEPGVIIDPSCEMLIKACAGAYQFKRVQVKGDVFQDVPDKKAHPFSDIADCAQYAAMEARTGLYQEEFPPPPIVQPSWGAFV